MKKTLTTLIGVLFLFIIAHIGISELSAEEKHNYTKFDIFGIDMLCPKNYFNEKIQKNIAKTLQRKFGVDVEGYGGSMCVNVDKDINVLTWDCSEMHGCEFAIYMVKKNDNCSTPKWLKFFPIIKMPQHVCSLLSEWNENPRDILEACRNGIRRICSSQFESNIIAEEDCEKKREVSRTAKQFHPLSNNYPQIRLGETTRSRLIELFGKPAYKDNEKIIYASYRDKKFEQGCGYDAKSGVFSGRQMIIYFDEQSRLIGVSVDDGAGEC